MTTTWGSRRIGFSLIVEPRRDLVISVYPDLRVQVRAPNHRSLGHVLRRVEARRSWIARQLREFEQLTPLPPPRFLSGETMMYLGREYRLKVRENFEGVALCAGRLNVGASWYQRARVRRMVNTWYADRARAVFGRRMERLRQVALFTGLEPQVRVRRMERRWGSCTPHGTVTLNPALVQAPLACIDYVIAHELVHLIEPSHSARFYRLLGAAVPDWRHHRDQLARAAVRWT